MFEKFANNTCKVENEHRENNYKRESEKENEKFSKTSRNNNNQHCEETQH